MRFTDIQRVRIRALGVLGAMVIGTLLGVSVRLDMIHAMSWFAIACGLIACSILFGRFFRHRFRACLLFLGVVAIS
ncbi:MAG: hypothetical protein JKX70_09390, partial [Phycisphaerales bacterium]|nr:hypothetical protein [Phycisphaerales bacterium]